MLKKWVWMGLLAGVLSSCAPTVLGGSPFMPLDISEGQVTQLKPESVTFVAVQYGGGAWGITTTDINAVLGSAGGLARGDTVKVPVGWMSLKEVRTPSGVKVWLDRTNVRRDVTDRTDKFVYFDQTIELIFGVEVPKGVISGGLVVADVHSNRTNRSYPVRFTVNIN